MPLCDIISDTHSASPNGPTKILFYRPAQLAHGDFDDGRERRL
jgi:hypothetical protein